MSNIQFLTLSGDVRKRLVSNESTVDFLSVKIGASALEIKETAGNFDFSAKKLTNLAEPTSNQDAATKAYVDNVAIGLDVHGAVLAATTGNLAVTPSGSQVGKTLTATSNGDLTIDGYNTFNVGDRVLVKDQTLAVNNGIYVVTDPGDINNPYVLTRSSDFDGSPGTEVSGGDFVFVQLGTVNGHTGWLVTNDGAITVDTDPINWTIFSAAGTVTAGAGILQTGNTFDIVAADNSMTINADSIQVKLSDEGAIGFGAAGHLGLKVNTDGSTLEIATNALQVKALGIQTSHLAGNSVTALKLNSDVAGIAIGMHAVTNAIDVKFDNSTIGVNVSNELEIKDNGVSTAKIAADAVTKDKINADVAGSGLGQNVDGSLEVKVDNVGIEIATDIVQLKDAGITAAKLAANSVTAAKLNADTAGAGLALNGTTNALEIQTGEGTKIVSDAVVADYAITKQNDNGSPITANQIVYVKANGNVDLALASVTSLHSFELGIVEAASIAAAASGKIILKRGATVAGFTGLTPGKKLYVSRSTAGSWQHDLTGFVAGEFVYSVGRAIDTTRVSYDPNFEFEF